MSGRSILNVDEGNIRLLTEPKIIREFLRTGRSIVYKVRTPNINMRKKHGLDPIILIGFLGIITFLALGIYSISVKDVEFIFDRFFSAAIVSFSLYLYKKIQIKPSVLLFGLLILIFHHLKLYGNFYFGIPFDRGIHLLAGIFLGLVFYGYFSKVIKNKAVVITFSILVSLGLSSILEIIEFVGYSFLGSGEGILFYGTGDIGEWNNTIWDMISNLLGTFLGNLILLIKNISYKNK